MEDEHVKYELPNFEPKSPALTPLENLAQEISPRHLTQVRSIPAHLLDYHCYIVLITLHEPYTFREASTNYLWHIAMKEELDALSKNHCKRLRPPTRFWMLGQTHVNGWSHVIASQNGGTIDYIFPFRLRVL